MKRDFTTRFNKEILTDKSFAKQIGIAAIVLFLSVIMFNTSGCTKNEDISIEDNTVQLEKDTVKVGDDGVNAAIAPDDVSLVSNQEAIKSNQLMVSVPVEDIGRSNPFLPDGGQEIVSSPKPKNYDLLPPPDVITVDTAAAEVITTKVSGIMYDKFNPSAILNISGSDYLVRTGDVINNYKVLSIGKDTVTVQYGANVYKAGVGELFNGEGINFNTISNLNSKFGGRKNSSGKN